MRNIFLCFLCFSVFLLVGCNSNMETSDTISVEIDERSNGEVTNPETESSLKEVFEYEDESETTLIYGRLSIEFDSYHIASCIKTETMETYLMQKNENEKNRVEEIQLTVKEFNMNEFSSVDDVTDFFTDLHSSIDSIHAYENISDESEINHLYCVIEGEKAYYYVFYDNVTYVIESTYTILEFMLFKDFQKETFIMSKEIIECGKSRYAFLEKHIFSEKNILLYKVSDEFDSESIKHYAEYSKGEDGLYHFIVKNGDEKEELELISYVLDVYESVEFLDVNLDGYIDIKFLSDAGTMNNEYKLFLWNSALGKFESVECNETLSTIEVHEGYILNWRKADVGAGVVQKLVWDGNVLIKESEEEY